MDQQLFKFKVNDGHKESQETSNSDKLTNLGLWGVDADFKSYMNRNGQFMKFYRNVGFYPPTENPCVMRRENLKTKSSEYIVIYQDDLYIASQTPEDILNNLQDKYKIKINPDVYLGLNCPHDPGGTMICQLRKYLEKLYVNVNILFKDQLPTDLQLYIKIIKLLITKGNPTLIHNETTYEYLNHLSRKRKLNKL